MTLPRDDQEVINDGEYPLFASILRVLTETGKSVPAWWTPDRDKFLRNQVVKIDFLESAVNTIVLKLFSIPFTVVSKNNSSLIMQRYASEYQKTLTNLLMQDYTLEKFIRSFLISDNGAFMYVDDGITPNDQPLQSTPIELRWLDSTRCQRTGDPTYPVIYWHSDNNKAYPLHDSRVISLVQSPSTNGEMHNVGLCFVSRAILLAQHLADIYLYEGEVMGSRSSEEIIYATGATSKAIDDAFGVAEIDSDNAGYRRYGKRVYLGLRDPNAKIGKLNLKSLPEKFDKRNDIEITLTLLAMASGGSPNWFYDSVKSGSTKASASESTKMGESKIETWFIRNFSNQIERKYLPEFLTLVNRNADIDTTGIKARIKLNLAQKSKLNVESGVTNARVERQAMLEREEIDVITFEDLELQDGRTPNGLPIYAFYETDNTDLQALLYFTDNPLDFDVNDPEEMLELSEPYLKLAQNIALTSLNIDEQRLGIYAMYTLDYVRDQYRERITSKVVELNEPEPDDEINNEEEVLNGMNDDDVIDNNALEKAIQVDQKAFSTRGLRTLKSNIRSCCREYWNQNISKQQFFERMHQFFMDNEDYNYQLVTNYIKDLGDFINVNNRANNGKLYNIYKKSDQFITYKN